MKRWSSILNNNPNVDNVFKFSVSYTKTKEDGTLKQYVYAVDIPDTYADMVIGERKVIKQLKRAWETAETAQDMAQFYAYLSARISEVKENFKYKWGAMIEANDLYFNPLWNVDGTEIVEEDRAKRKATDTLGEREDSTVYGEQENTNEYGQHELTDSHGNGQAHTDTYAHGAQHKTVNFGNGSSYTDQIQYGLDKTENTTGARTNTTENKVNPFNDSNTEYETDKKIETSNQVVDSTERKVHTDTTTHGTHTDAEDLQSYNDSTTYGAYTDKQTSSTHTDTLTAGGHTDTINKGEQENTHEEDAYKDTITTTRRGNIGVTKSTELLRDYRNLPSECYTPILLDLMSILSRGY